MEPTPQVQERDAAARRASFRFWRRVPLRQQMLYGFAAPIVIMLLASLFLIHGLGTLEETAQASVISAESIGLRHELLAAVVDEETGVRGFQLTGDPVFLEPYTLGQSHFAQTGARIEALEHASPIDLGYLHDVQALEERWQHDFAQPQIALRRHTPVAAASQLTLLATLLLSSPSGVAPPDRVQEYDAAVERLRDSVALMVPGPRTDRLRAAIALAAGVRSAGVVDVPTRARLVSTLLSLADDVQADEDRISSGTVARQGKAMVDGMRLAIQVSLRQEIFEQRDAAAKAGQEIDHAVWIAITVPLGGMLVGLALTLMLLVDAIRAIGATADAAVAVAGGDLKKRLSVRRGDEIGDLGDAFNRMAAELAHRHRRAAAIDRFQNLLVTSNSMEEIHAVVARMCEDVFPESSGAIYRIAPSRNIAELMTTWNWPAATNGKIMHPEDCRAMRSGRPYFASGASLEVPCRHVQELGTQVARSICLPLAAQGEMHGVLFLCRFAGHVHDEAKPHDIETAVLIAEQLSMSLANMQLREQLRNQSIRDPLTGLFNRRYLEETMERELGRSLRNGLPLAVIAIDVDHFKRFNDEHGHEAGDKVLVELAGVLRGGIRSTDIACRYGGEEFVLLMPDSPPEVAQARVEALRRRTAELRVHCGDAQLDPVTISCGVALAPAHGETGEALIRNADTALYAAKAAGRDRVIVFSAG